MRKGVVFFFAGAAVFAMTDHAVSETITKPYTFVDGTTASAAEVNADFDTVYNQVNKIGSMVTVDPINQWVGIGTAMPASTFEVASDFALSGLASLTVTSYYNDASRHPAHIYGRRARGSMTAPSPVLGGDSIFMLGPKGYNGLTGFGHGYNAAIDFRAAEDFAGAGMGTDILFTTTPNGATSRLERMRIGQDGRVGIGTTAPESMLEVVSDYAVTGVPSKMLLTTYRDAYSGTPSVMHGRRARGSAGLPAAVQGGDFLFTVSGSGYGSTGWGAERYNATMQFLATENFTDLSKGTAIRFRTTPNGSTIAQDRLYIDQNGYVGLGTTTPERNLDITADYAETGADGGINVTTYYNGGGHPTVITGSRARGSKNAPSALLAGDKMLSISSKGYGDTGFGPGGPFGPTATIQFIATENFTDAAKGTAITFANAANGTTARTERVRIDQNGNVGIGTATPQATLDVNGFMKLAKNTAEPVACDAATDGALALTSQYRMCVCNGDALTWVSTSDGLTSCSW